MSTPAQGVASPMITRGVRRGGGGAFTSHEKSPKSPRVKSADAVAFAPPPPSAASSSSSRRASARNVRYGNRMIGCSVVIRSGRTRQQPVPPRDTPPPPTLSRFNLARQRAPAARHDVLRLDPARPKLTSRARARAGGEERACGITCHVIVWHRAHEGSGDELRMERARGATRRRKWATHHRDIALMSSWYSERACGGKFERCHAAENSETMANSASAARLRCRS